MIITVTLNPALDKFIQLDKLKVGELNRYKKTVVRAGGKGINVARVLNILKREVLAMTILGGSTGKRIKKLMKEENIPFDIILTEINTRENIKLIEESKRETEVNQKGHIDYKSFFEFKELLKKRLKRATILILAGSVPEGLSPEIYQELINLAKEHDVKTILDTSGVPLRSGIECRPYLIKPNIFELGDLIGKDLSSISDVYDSMKTLLNKGVETIVVSLGEQGALYANKEECYQIIPPEVNIPYSTVGAGDSMVAGLASAIDKGYNLRDMAKYVTSIATLYVSGNEITEEHIRNMKDRLEMVEGEHLK